MKKIVFSCLVFCFSTKAFAGGVLLCDDHGHMCIRPGGINCVLIPPVHGCSDNEIDDFLSIRSATETDTMAPQGWNPDC
jgi:hypothetical protein